MSVSQKLFSDKSSILYSSKMHENYTIMGQIYTTHSIYKQKKYKSKCVNSVRPM